MSLNTKTAIVTGASHGIGKAIALGLAQQGARVVINYYQSKDAAEALVEKIQNEDGQAIAIQANVSEQHELEKLFKSARYEFGAIDILVNNAGLLIKKEIQDCTEKDYQKTFDLNLKSVFLACTIAATELSEAGRIINISTTVTKMVLPGYGLYAASKAAVDQLTRVLAQELGEKKITVNAVCPGPTDTQLFRENKREKEIRQMADFSPLGRIGQPEDIAKVVSFLASDASQWITGQTLYANGGIA